MELKYDASAVASYASAGSNRTFMELKYVIVPLVNYLMLCSNRTFMELKFAVCSEGDCPVYPF